MVNCACCCVGPAASHDYDYKKNQANNICFSTDYYPYGAVDYNLNHFIEICFFLRHAQSSETEQTHFIQSHRGIRVGKVFHKSPLFCDNCNQLKTLILNQVNIVPEMSLLRSDTVFCCHKSEPNIQL